MPSFYSFFRRNKDSKKKGGDGNSKKDAMPSPNPKAEPERAFCKFPGRSRCTTPRGRFQRTEEEEEEDRGSVKAAVRTIHHCSNHSSSDIASGIPWISSSPSRSVSRCPSNLETVMPLPLPGPICGGTKPRSGTQSFVPLQRLNVGTGIKSSNMDPDETSGCLTDSASSDCSSESGIGHEVLPPFRNCCDDEAIRSNHSSVVLESSQRMPGHLAIHSPTRIDVTQPGSPLGAVSSQKLEFRNGQGEGGDLHIHIHVNGVQNSASNSTFSSPVLSPRALGPPEPGWLWNPTSNHLQQTSSTTSGQNSGHNSISSDFLLQHRRPSSDLSPRTQSRSVSPRHPLSNCTGYDSSSWADVHPLPRPPTSGTTTASPSTPLSPRSSGIPPRSPKSKMERGASIGKWQKGRLLGSGSFGKVYKGIHSETGEFCAIKEVEFVRDDPKSKESAKQLAQEIVVLSTLRHPNIVHYKGSEMVGGSLYIYLELVSGGSIYKLYQEFRKFEEPVIRRYTRQILQGLHFLHSVNMVHRDIKGANILVDQDGTVKLADFGMAKHIKEQGVPLSFKGSPYWMAPEVIMQRNMGYEFAVDIWSLGCTIVEMVTGKPPWSEYEGVAAMFKVTRAETPPIPENLSPEGQSFIRFCLQRNPADRPSAAQLLEHSFVQIPDEVPDLGKHLLSIPDFLSAKEKGERNSQHDCENSSSRGSLRHAGPQISNARSCLYPSMSAPVSPKSSFHALGGSGLVPTHLDGMLPGFSTPVIRGGHSALPSPGFSLYTTDVRNPSNIAHRRSGSRPDIQHGIPSLHVTVNGPDSQWDLVPENRQKPPNYPRSSGIYVSRNPRSSEPAQDRLSSRRSSVSLQRMVDEKISKVLLKRSSHYHMPPKYNDRESRTGSQTYGHE